MTQRKLPKPAGSRYATSLIRPKNDVMGTFLDPQEVLGELTKNVVMGLLNHTENFDEPISIEIKPHTMLNGLDAYRIDAEQTVPETVEEKK